MMAAAWMVAACGGGGDDIATPVTPAPTPSPVTPTPTPSMPTAIAFMGSIPEEQSENHGATRAEEEGLETYYKQFKVWAFKHLDSATENVMDGYTVRWVENSAGTALSNTHGWEYVNQQSLDETEQSIKYWDYSASAYRFFGVAPESYSGSVSGDYYVLTFEDVDVTADEGIAAAPYFSELWYSSDKSQYGKPVKLLFKQPVSKVRFRFTSDDPRVAADAVLSGISFRPTDGSKIYRKGNFTLRYPLTGADTRESFSVANTDPATALDALTEHYTDANQKWYTVLPANGQGTYTLEVTINGGDPKTAVVPAEFMNWQPGFEYTYIFKINEEGGVSIDVVQSAFTEWADDQTGEHVIYNW